jgi:guanidinoacetate N-methyltransferase
MRKLKRLPEFDVSFQIKSEDFIAPPRSYQRNWLLNQTINEFAHDLYALHNIAGNFVHGSEVQGMEDRTQAILDEEEIMEDWQIPIMQVMAKSVTRNRGSILEIGFGRGIGSGFIQNCGADKHTIIECNDSIVARLQDWKKQYFGSQIEVAHGLWQDELPKLGEFDGVFFHTYPLKEEDYLEQIAQSTTFAEHFFAHAAAHLHKGGVFTYLSNEIDSLSRHHQRLLFAHFEHIETRVIKNLNMPENVKDQWWADSMILISAIK